MSTFDKPKPAGTPTWFDLTTPDAAKARAFYTALFGWSYNIGGPDYGYYAVAVLDGKPVAGIGESPADTPMPPAWVVQLATEDADADAAKVKALGGQLLAEPMQIGSFGRMAMCADPTGAVFGLWQAGNHIGAELTEVPGTMVWCEVNSRDAVKARDFYCSLFGLTWSPMPGMEYYTLQRGEANLAGVLQMDQNWHESIPAHWIPYFAVANTDETIKVALENGGKVRVEPFDTPFGRIAWIEDPFGAVFVALAR